MTIGTYGLSFLLRKSFEASERRLTRNPESPQIYGNGMAFDGLMRDEWNLEEMGILSGIHAVFSEVFIIWRISRT